MAHILEGSVQKAGDEVRVNVQLINAANDAHLWAETYDRRLNDIFGVESEIARTVADTLQAKLTGYERHAISTRPTNNPVAYEDYLKGRYFWSKLTGDDFKTAISYFEQAIDKDPGFALAYAGLADTYLLVPAFTWAAPQDTMPKAKVASQKALQLDDTLAEAHTSLAMVLRVYDFDYARALAEFKRAIELNPNYAVAHYWFGTHVLSALARFDEAIAEVKRAIELDPLSVVANVDLAMTYVYARRFDNAIDQARKAIQLDTNFYYAHYTLGLALEGKGLLMQPLRNLRRRTVSMTILMCQACSGTPTRCVVGETTRSKSWHNYRLNPFAVMCRPIVLPLSILAWAIEMKHCAGLKKISTIGMDGMLDSSASIRNWTRRAATRVSKNSLIK